jgi:putative FmdB family regulatory protein
VPTYQYACTECGEQLEKVQKFSDDPLTVCPNCSGRLRKVFSPVGIVFKGSGFYRTDSRSGGNGSLSGKDASDAKDGKDGKDKAESGSKSSDKTDSSAKSDSSGSSGGASKDSSTSSSSSSGSSSGKSSGEKVA